MFELGYDLGHKWGNRDHGSHAVAFDLLIEKIEEGDSEWVEVKCYEIIAEFYPDLPGIEGPWRNLFVYGFAAGAYGVLPELEQKLKELQRQIEQMQRGKSQGSGG